MLNEERNFLSCPLQISEKQLYETEKKFKMYEAMINVMEEEVSAYYS